MTRIPTLMLSTASLLAVGPASAAVMYIDATDGAAGNTTLVGGATFTATGGDSAQANDNWDLRVDGNDNTLFESGGVGGEDSPRLATTITGLAAGSTYDIYAYFQGNTNHNWRGRVGLIDEAGNLPLYNSNHFASSGATPMTALSHNLGSNGLNPGPITTADAGGIENGGYFANTVRTLSTDGNRALYQVSVGQAVADSNGEVIVYIDDLADQANGNNRARYDGVGYELVPEPGSLALLALGGLMVARRRRG